MKSYTSSISKQKILDCLTISKVAAKMMAFIVGSKPIGTTQRETKGVQEKGRSMNILKILDYIELQSCQRQWNTPEPDQTTSCWSYQPLVTHQLIIPIVLHVVCDLLVLFYLKLNITATLARAEWPLDLEDSFTISILQWEPRIDKSTILERVSILTHLLSLHLIYITNDSSRRWLHFYCLEATEAAPRGATQWTLNMNDFPLIIVKDLHGKRTRGSTTLTHQTIRTYE